MAVIEIVIKDGLVKVVHDLIEEDTIELVEGTDYTVFYEDYDEKPKQEEGDKS